MKEANYQTWMQKHNAQVARIEANLKSIRLVTGVQPDTEADKAGDVSDTAPGRKKGSLLRSLAGRLCGRGE
jgi:hypothetical protein